MTVRTFVHSVTGRTLRAQEGTRLFDLVSGDDNYREDRASDEDAPKRTAKKASARRSSK